MKPSGKIDYSAIHNTLDMLYDEVKKTKRNPKDILIVIRSTAVSGTTDNLAEKMFTAAEWRPKKIKIENSPHGSVKRRLADISKLQKLVGWKPEVSLEDGIRQTHEWYKKNPKPKK